MPLEGGISGWLGFLGSVGDGTDATAEQYTAFTERCPDSKVVLAGYSQGAMIVHRNLYKLADDPHLAAALLIADGDRLPVDTTIKLGSTAITAGRGEGVAQEHSFLASTNTCATAARDRYPHHQRLRCRRSGLRLRPRHRTVTPAAIAIHTAYAPTFGGPHAWGAQLYSLVAAADPAPSVQLTAHTA